jgi:hypothetical protein
MSAAIWLTLLLSGTGYNITMDLGVDTDNQYWEAPTGLVIDI